MLNAMSGFDARDSTSAERPDEDYTAGLDAALTGLRIGLPKEFFGCRARSRRRPGHRGRDQRTRSTGRTGHRDRAAQHPSLDPGLLRRCPGGMLLEPRALRWGTLTVTVALRRPDLHDLYCRSRGEGFGAEVKRRIMIGTYALSAGYYDAYYLKAQQIRRLIRDDYRRAFERVDVIMGPTSPSVAFKLGEKTGDPITMYLSDIYTISINLAGLPGHVHPGRLRGGAARRPTAHRRALRRGAAPQHRPPLSASDRLAPARATGHRAEKSSSAWIQTGTYSGMDCRNPAHWRTRPGLAIPPGDDDVDGSDDYGTTRGGERMDWEPVIGLEIHAQLATRSKIFSGAADRLRRPAQHPGLRRGPRAARGPAGPEPGSRAHGGPVRSRDRGPR